MSPAVSVVIPVYNADRFLAEAAESVIAQGSIVGELILVDDGSTDKSRQVMENCQREYGRRIRCFYQANQGAAAARNKGIEEAQFDYCAFLDADDVWFREKLDLQVRFLEQHPRFGLVCSNWRLLDDEGAAKRFEAPLCGADQTLDLSGWLYTTLLMSVKVWTSTVVMRRAAMQQVGKFDGSLRRGQDYDYWLRSSQSMEIARLAQPTAFYRQHEASITQRPHPVNYEYLVLSRNVSRWGLKGVDGSILSARTYRRRLYRCLHSFWWQQFHNGSDPAVLRESALHLLRKFPLAPGAWKCFLRTHLADRRRSREADCGEL